MNSPTNRALGVVLVSGGGSLGVRLRGYQIAVIGAVAITGAAPTTKVVDWPKANDKPPAPCWADNRKALKRRLRIRH